ncbi:MAG: dipeptidase PepE [Burkholderiaceae bacterium]
MRLLLLSNAKREGSAYLEWAEPLFADFFQPARVKKMLFVPFAGVTTGPDTYVEKVRPVFARLGIEVEGVHTAADPVAAVNAAQAVVVGGGSTWKLLRDVRALRLLRAIRQRALAGMPYAGWSAGSNLACPTIMTSNDMPICDPGGLDALGLVPFQINPHYLHGNPPGFKGETREERITEFCAMNQGVWVAGLRECTGFRVEGTKLKLVGDAGDCRVFRHGQAPVEITPGADVQFLMDER